MEVTSEDLRRHYESLTDYQLIDLYIKNKLNVTDKKRIQIGLLFPININLNVSNELTETATSILKEVLLDRDITEAQLNNYISEQTEKILDKRDVTLRETIVHDLTIKKILRNFAIVVVIVLTAPLFLPFLLIYILALSRGKGW